MLTHRVFYKSRWPTFVFSISGQKCEGCFMFIKSVIGLGHAPGNHSWKLRVSVRVCVHLCALCWDNRCLWATVKPVHYLLTPRSLSAGAALVLPICVNTTGTVGPCLSEPPPPSSLHLILSSKHVKLPANGDLWHARHGRCRLAYCLRVQFLQLFGEFGEKH